MQPNFEATESEWSMYSDMYKDVFGCRPRGNLPESREAFDNDIQYFAREIEQQQRDLKIERLQALRRFFKQVRETIEIGAGDLRTAVRWMIQNQDTAFTDEDGKVSFRVGYFLFLNQMDYRHEKRITRWLEAAES